MCIGIAVLEIQERLKERYGVKGTELCVINGQRNTCSVSRKKRASQGKSLRITNCQNRCKEKENFLYKTGEEREDQKDLTAWTPVQRGATLSNAEWSSRAALKESTDACASNGDTCNRNKKYGQKTVLLNLLKYSPSDPRFPPKNFPSKMLSTKTSSNFFWVLLNYMTLIEIIFYFFWIRN